MAKIIDVAGMNMIEATALLVGKFGFQPHEAENFYNAAHGLPFGDMENNSAKRVAEKAVSAIKGFNPSQPRVPAGGPGGGEWVAAGGLSGRIRSGLGKVGAGLRSLSKNPKIAPQGPVFAKPGEGQKLGKLERIAISQGVRQMVAHIPISNVTVRSALTIGLNIIVPRVIARLSPPYRKVVMRAMYAAMVGNALKGLATILHLVSLARAGTMESEMRSAMEQMTPSNESKADLEAMVASWTGKAVRDEESGIEELASKIADIVTKTAKDMRGTQKEASLFTTKESSGKYRWTIIGSGAYGPDRDGEWMTEKALRSWADGFTERGGIIPVRSNGEPVSLRWWHVGKPDPETLSKGPGIDLGIGDFAAVHSKSLIISGLFDDPDVGEAISKNIDRLGASIGFFHPQMEPVNKEFRQIDIYEVSLLPVERASYPFTGLTVAKGN